MVSVSIVVNKFFLNFLVYIYFVSCSSSLHQEYDQNQDGVISQKEFQAAMTAQKMYTQ